MADENHPGCEVGAGPLTSFPVLIAAIPLCIPPGRQNG
jgi:hypothetical protein